MLSGKRALVTAASAGLGRACAEKLATEGCRVAICARGREALDEAARFIGAVPIPADLANATDAIRLAETAAAALGGLDIVVVNAGHVAYGDIESLADRDWEAAFQMLLLGAARLVRGAIPHLRAARGGSIVFIGSASVRNPPPHLLLSSVMRLGVAGLAKTLASHLAKDGIRVNVVAPGYFETGRVQRRILARQAEGISAQEAMQEVAGSVPIGRIGRAEELAEMVAFLASDKCGFMTGAHIPIDGGATPYPL